MGPEACVVSCDNVTVPVDALDDEAIGHLDELTRARSTKPDKLAIVY